MAAVVGVGPIGTQQVVAVVVPAAGSQRVSGPLASPDLAAAVRAAAAADPAGRGADQSAAAHRHPARVQDRPGRGGPLGGSGAGRPAGGTTVRVLVTGASGMLGSATARALAARGDRVTVLQRRPAGLGLPEVLADVADTDAVRRCGGRPRCGGAPGGQGRRHRTVGGIRPGQHRWHPIGDRRLPRCWGRAARTRVLALGCPRRGATGRGRRGARRPDTRPRLVRKEQGGGGADRTGRRRRSARRDRDPSAPGLGTGGHPAGQSGGRPGPGGPACSGRVGSGADRQHLCRQRGGRPGGRRRPLPGGGRSGAGGDQRRAATGRRDARRDLRRRRGTGSAPPGSAKAGHHDRVAGRRSVGRTRPGRVDRRPADDPVRRRAALHRALVRPATHLRPAQLEACGQPGGGLRGPGVMVSPERLDPD